MRPAAVEVLLDLPRAVVFLLLPPPPQEDCGKPSSNSPKSSASAPPSSKSSKSSPKSSASSSPSRPAPNDAGLLLDRAVLGVFNGGDIGVSTNCQWAGGRELERRKGKKGYTSVPVMLSPLSSTLPSAFNTRSGGGSALCFFSGCSRDPSESGDSSTTVLGMGCPPGERSSSSPLAAFLIWSGMMAISSGAASPSLRRYASVPGTSPYDGSSLTFSTLVLGMGEFRCDSDGTDWASEKWSSESDDSTGRVY